MWQTSTVALSILLALLASLGAFIYLFGIPPAMKRWIEEQALETMGENKASFAVKSSVDKLPEADQDEIKGIRSGAKETLGTGLQNPLGKEAGNVADDTTKPLTGR